MAFTVPVTKKKKKKKERKKKAQFFLLCFDVLSSLFSAVRSYNLPWKYNYL